MIIYGSNSTQLKSIQSKTQTCPNCSKAGTLEFSAFSGHAHIFWIPLFPYNKKGFSHCQNCGETIEKKAMSEKIKREYDSLKGQIRTPIWKFSGLFLIAIFFSWIAISNSIDTKNELTYLSNPAVGDIYEYEIQAKEYSSLKVRSISDDSVFVSPNDYLVDRKSGIYEIDIVRNYPKFSYGISKTDLAEMYENKTLFGIIRNEN